MSSIFTKIINREIPAYIIAEDESYIAFLDAFPLTRGHVLVVPKEEVNRIFDLADDVYIGLMKFAKKIAPAISKSFPCDRVGMSVIGLEVPHVHVHLLPLNTIADITFTNPKLQLEQDEMIDIQNKIKSNL